MDTESRIARVEEILQPWSEGSRRLQADNLEIRIQREHLLEAVEALLAARWGYLSAITGLQVPAPAGAGEAVEKPVFNTEVIYHFSEGNVVLNLRMLLPADEPLTVPSVCGLIPSASLYERELQEMFGVTVEGTPDNRRLVLPDDWPEGVYPLRKDFAGLNEAGAAESQEGVG